VRVGARVLDDERGLPAREHRRAVRVGEREDVAGGEAESAPVVDVVDPQQAVVDGRDEGEIDPQALGDEPQDVRQHDVGGVRRAHGVRGGLGERGQVGGERGQPGRRRGGGGPPLQRIGWRVGPVRGE